MRILAVLCVRDEGAYLIEWFAHARAVGFTDILVFSNDCRDGTDAMLDRLADLGWCVHLRNDGGGERGPQWAALRAADRHPLAAAADWAIVLDIDEFVNVQVGDRTIPALLAALPRATAIPLVWRMFGNAGVVGFEDRPVTAQFTRSAPAVLHWPWRAQQVKTLFRRDGTYARFGVHRPRDPVPARLAGAVWIDGAGRPLPEAWQTTRVFADLGADHGLLARLNHYALGSMESFLVKADRGRANRQGAPADAGYWVERNFAAVEDASILALEPRAAPLRAALHADPVLGPLHAAAVAWRRARFAALMGEEPWRALFGRLMLCPPARVLTEAEARRIWARGGA
jgi:hypothetical protein